MNTPNNNPETELTRTADRDNYYLTIYCYGIGYTYYSAFRCEIKNETLSRHEALARFTGIPENYTAHKIEAAHPGASIRITYTYPATEQTRKYNYPANLTDKEKKAFRAKARRAAKGK